MTALRKTSVPRPSKSAALDEYRKDLNEEFRIVEEDTFDRLREALRGQSVDRGPGLSKGNTITDEFLNGLEHDAVVPSVHV